MSSWAPMVPFAKARLGLDEARLGLVLLCMGLGSAVAMPLAGFLSQRRGNRGVLAVSASLAACALPLLALATTTALLAAALLLFGAALGVLDVAMNAHPVDVERMSDRPLMSGFHALFSIGGLTGAAAVSALLKAGVPLIACALVVAAVLLGLVATQWRHLLAAVPDRATARRSMFAVPSPITVLIGILCLVLFLAEGAMLDWGAVFLHAERGVVLEDAGVGYSVFSVAMAIGRLTGDRVTAALGPVRVVRLGSVVAASGFILACVLPWPSTTLAGFALVGIGASNIVPVLFSAAGRIPDTAPGIAIATATTLGYTGLLSGPAVIGLIARATTLPFALGCIAVLLVGVCAGASIVRIRP
jgi:predicted MFS family arabinose efflux permease